MGVSGGQEKKRNGLAVMQPTRETKISSFFLDQLANVGYL
jgi:hypothetical protein